MASAIERDHSQCATDFPQPPPPPPAFSLFTSCELMKLIRRNNRAHRERPLRRRLWRRRAAGWMELGTDVRSCGLLLARNIFAPLVTNRSVTHICTHAHARTNQSLTCRLWRATAAPGNEAEKQNRLVGSSFGCVQTAGESDSNQIPSPF